jgi:hypothetical protein
LILVSLHWDVPGDTSSIRHTTMTLLQTLGVTTFGVGILNIVLETNSWRNYLGDRVKDVIIEQSYLQVMDKDALRTIQTNVFKALFKDKTIDREDSFLDCFHSNLNKYIGASYREDVTTEIICVDADGKNAWKVFQCITYTCRKSSEAIQPDVQWEPDEYENIDVISIIITIRYPYNHERFGKEISNERLILTTGQGGYLKMKYDSWMLPQSGIAWRFIPRAPISSESAETPSYEGSNTTETTTPQSRIEAE